MIEVAEFFSDTGLQTLAGSIFCEFPINVSLARRTIWIAANGLRNNDATNIWYTSVRLDFLLNAAVVCSIKHRQANNTAPAIPLAPDYPDGETPYEFKTSNGPSLRFNDPAGGGPDRLFVDIPPLPDAIIQADAVRLHIVDQVNTTGVGGLIWIYGVRVQSTLAI